MKLNKIFIMLLLIMTTCLLLFACANTEQGDASDRKETTEPKENTEVKEEVDTNETVETEEDVENLENAGDTIDYMRTQGIWRVDGVYDTAYIYMDGAGGCECYYADGVLEIQGYLEYDSNKENYTIYDLSESYFADFYFETDTLIHFGNEDGTSYIKDEVTGNEEVHENNGVQIPVLMGGAIFTGMEPLITENYEDGGYYYSEMTEDGMTVIINSAQTNAMGIDETIDDYIIECAYALGNDVVLEPEITLDEEYSAKLTYPVYRVSWLTGQNEDTKRWEMFLFMTDSHTYTYVFNSGVDNAEEMLDIWLETFENLYLG
ncbi:MAG: hypothetical protein ACERKZ_21250 [Lachnotalea sp.]